MRCFRYIGYSHEIAEALGEPSHIVQVEIIGAFKSKTAFARALVDAKLAQTARSALNAMRHSGGETWNETSVAVTSAEPEQLFAGSLNGSRRGEHIHVPLKDI